MKAPVSLIAGVCITLSCASICKADFSELWSVEQGIYEVGWCWVDLNGDGIREIIKEDGTGSSFYDGANEYELLWSVGDPDPGENSGYYFVEYSADYYVFLQQDTDAQQSRFDIYLLNGSEPVWNSGTLSGNCSQYSIADVDGDGNLEFAYSYHRSAEDVWTSRWYVRDLASGTLEHDSAEFAGYLVGPYLGNVEGDASSEILLNIYASDWSSSQLVCWGDPETDLARVPTSFEQELKAWPNPLNPSCRVQLPAGHAGGVLQIFNMAGQRVRQLQVGPAATQTVWDGLGEGGRPLASGAYLIHYAGERLPVTLLR